MKFLWMDLRYAWRAARRSPGVTISIIVMLALGTGGVTAVFNPIYSQVFAPLPFPQPEQLVITGGDVRGLFNVYQSSFENRDELDRFFLKLTAYGSWISVIRIPDTGNFKEVLPVLATEEFFETLGVRPLRGAGFSRNNNNDEIVVSNRFWREELNGADDAVGSQIQMNNAFVSIVGIMPENFDFPTGTDIWINHKTGRGWRGDALWLMGRLRPGITPGRIEEELRAVNGPALQPLRTVLYGERRPMLLMLGSAAILFLLLVCAGVMNLLVTRGERRKSEMAMRLILGATRRNLVFQLLRETLPLVVAGALAGLWISEIAGMWLHARFPLLRGGEVVVPVKMAFFATLVFAVTIIGGLTPALYVSGVNLNTYLKSGSDAKWRFFSFSVRELLTAAQFGLALALLTGVVLLVNSLITNVDIPITWSSRDMVAVHVDVAAEFPSTGSRDALIRREMFYRDFQDNLSAMPEVAVSGIFVPIPFSAQAVYAGRNMTVRVSKTQSSEQEEITRVTAGYANPEGFKMLGITLIAGRFFTPAETANETEFLSTLRSLDREKILALRDAGFVRAAIINQYLARQLWPEENAVGKIIYDMYAFANEIVGIVQDFHQTVDNKNIVPVIYHPADNMATEQRFLVRLNSGALMQDFRRRLSSLETGMVKIGVQPHGDVLSKSMANMYMTLQLLGIFALLGITAAGLGVYATTSLMMAAMNREMGIRMAMGAQIWYILHLALWRGTRAIIIGLPLGLFLAWILSRILSGFLFQVKTEDPLAWITSCALLIGITIIAALIPALRASCANPADILRRD